MIRGTTTSRNTILLYREEIAAWLRCQKVIRNDFLKQAAITLNIGDEERSGRVALTSMHPTKDVVLAKVTGQVQGGEHDGFIVVDFAPPQDERFRITTKETDLDAICVNTEILHPPVSKPPQYN